MRLAHAQDDVNPHILRMLEGTFSPGAAHLRHDMLKVTLSYTRITMALRCPHTESLGKIEYLEELQNTWAD